MKRIKFSKNWNNKLNCDIFTTIRKSSVSKFKYYKSVLGQRFEVILKFEPFREVNLINVQELYLKEIPLHVLRLDTGIEDLAKIEEIFKEFGIGDYDKCLLLTFSK